jgi:hypothetical protein
LLDCATGDKIDKPNTTDTSNNAIRLICISSSI